MSNVDSEALSWITISGLSVADMDSFPRIAALSNIGQHMLSRMSESPPDTFGAARTPTG